LTDAEVEALVSGGIPPEARRHQARVIVRAPAAQLAERFGPWIGRLEAIDEASCVLTTGAERVEDLAAYLGMLGADFSVADPPELVAQLRVLAARYAAATS
jgi:predicted DNA-binding transcriptional regulator YafY